MVPINVEHCCGPAMSSIDPVWRIARELAAQQPEAAELLAVANAHAWSAVSPILLELARLRIAMLIGNQAGLLRRSNAAREAGVSESKIALISSYPSSREFSRIEKDCLEFTELFVIDVSSLTEDNLTVLRSHFSAEQLPIFVMALYVTECTQRLEMVAPRLLDALPHVASEESVEARFAGLMQAMDAYQESVVRGTALDAVTTEMVRLRCARTHNCRFCKTLRLEDSVAAGVDDAMTAKIDFYEKSDLDERTKIALRVTDAVITRPDILTETAVAEARAAFSPLQLAEILFDITKWSTQKFYVATGTDAADSLPINAQGVSFFSFDSEGRVAGFAASPG
jgi:alkylhydroperoxidase family enzyme